MLFAFLYLVVTDKPAAAEKHGFESSCRLALRWNQLTVYRGAFLSQAHISRINDTCDKYLVSLIFHYFPSLKDQTALKSQ